MVVLQIERFLAQDSKDLSWNFENNILRNNEKEFFFWQKFSKVISSSRMSNFVIKREGTRTHVESGNVQSLVKITLMNNSQQIITLSPQ